jgi:hypothetical protein
MSVRTALLGYVATGLAVATGSAGVAVLLDLDVEVAVLLATIVVAWTGYGAIRYRDDLVDELDGRGA